MSKDFKIYNKWVKLSDLIEVQEDTDYYIQNKGQNTVFGLKTDKEPDDSIKNEGTALYPGMQGKYTHKVGFDLYLKIDNEINSIYSTINITNEI